MGQPGVYAASSTQSAIFSDPVASNLLKKPFSESPQHLLKAYYRASVYTVIGDPIYETVYRAVTRSSLADEMIVSMAAVGYIGRDVLPNSWRNPLSRLGRKLFDRAVASNTHFVPEQRLVGYNISQAHRLKGGRLAGLLVGSKSSYHAHAFNFGLGLAIDVGYQAWLDYDDPYLTGSQYRGRLQVAAAGSAFSFVAGTSASLGVATYFGLAVTSGPVVGTGIVVGVLASIAWDIGIAPVIYEYRGLNSERNLRTLQH